MKPETFTRVANLSELKTAGPFALSANGVDIVLLRTGGGWRAFDGRCPHQGVLLGEGELDGGALVCRNHRWRFSVDSGQRDGGQECLASCPVAERDGGVFVDMTRLKPSKGPRTATRSLDDLPGPSPLPLIGNLHQIDAKKVHLTLEGWAARYGSTYQFRMGTRRAIATADPALIKNALCARPDSMRRDADMDRIMAEIGVKGVFNAEGEAWRPQRKLAVAALAQRNLRQLYPSIRTVAARLKTRWEKSASNGETLDVLAELKRFTVDVTMLIAFGYDANTVEEADDVIQRELEIILPAVSRRIFAFFPTWRYVQTPSDRRLTRAFATVRAWLVGLLADARADLLAKPERAEKPSNFIEAMITAVDEQGNPFSDDVILSNLVTMLLAGEDTTSSTLAWAIHEVCDSPEWASEIRNEADAVIGSMEVAADVDAANRLTRASAVVDETLRLRPVGGVMGLEANVDTTLGDILVPKGTAVMVLARPAAVSPENFADPLAFRPERWLNARAAPHDVLANIPFGSGPRMCPGRSLALLEMKTLLSVLYKAFEVERVGASSGVTERFGVTMSPAGLKVRLHSWGSPRHEPHTGRAPLFSPDKLTGH